MPNELGGELRSGLPFTWQWRFFLPRPNNFELCWAVHDIPADESFGIPQKSIHRSHLNLKKHVELQGFVPKDKLADIFSGDKPLEVIVYFRIDGAADGGRIQIDYEIFEADRQRGITPTIKQSLHVQLKADEVKWLENMTSSRGGYGQACVGLGVEHGYSQLPLLSQNFSLEKPLKLLKLRSMKHKEGFNYESYSGPGPGLQVWVQKKSGLSPDQPHPVWVKFSEDGKPVISNSPNNAVNEKK